MKPSKKVALIGCGGTISTRASHAFDVLDYPETGHKLTANEMVSELQPLVDFADLEAIAFREVGSSKIGPTDWLELARLVRDLFDEKPELTGIVILHGTATLEETAFFLDLTLELDRPVVLVGAQRPLGAVGSDALSNAVAAIRTATDEKLRSMGVLIVFNDEIHSARDVAKGSTYRLNAFSSGAYGALGVVDPDGVRVRRAPLRSDVKFSISHLSALPRVDVLYAVAGGDETIARACIKAGARGLVSAGFAPGMTSPLEWKELLRAVSKGIPVVQCSRVASGRIARRLHLKEFSIVSGENLSAHKARILLMLGLTVTEETEALQNYFDQM